MTKNMMEEKDKLITKLNNRIFDLENKLKNMEDILNQNQYKINDSNSNPNSNNKIPPKHKSKSLIKGIKNKNIIINNKINFQNIDSSMLKERIGKKLNFNLEKNIGINLDFFKPLNPTQINNNSINYNTNPDIIKNSKSSKNVKSYLYSSYNYNKSTLQNLENLYLKHNSLHIKRNSCSSTSNNSFNLNNKNKISNSNNNSINLNTIHRNNNSEMNTAIHTQKTSPRYINRNEFLINEIFNTEHEIKIKSNEDNKNNFNELTSLDLIDQLQYLKLKTKNILQKFSDTNHKLVEKFKKHSYSKSNLY